MAKKTTNGRGGLWLAIIASFSLAILDMFFMKGVFEPNFGDIGGAAIAFALATTANISALLWGKEVGQGRKGRSFMWGWIIMGLIYVLIRAYGTYLELGKGITIEKIMLQITYVIILTISYVGSGTLIKWAAAQLWDRDVTDYMYSKREFEEQNSELANNKAAIWSMVKTFENYDENFKLLDSQYEKHKENIQKVEHSVMSQIVMKTIAEHPEIDPIDAEKVMENVLARRAEENEKAHNQHK